MENCQHQLQGAQFLLVPVPGPNHLQHPLETPSLVMEKPQPNNVSLPLLAPAAWSLLEECCEISRNLPLAKIHALPSSAMAKQVLCLLLRQWGLWDVAQKRI